jgi:hypothetical protein
MLKPEPTISSSSLITRIHLKPDLLRTGGVALGQTNRPPTIRRAATAAAARVKGHTDDQSLEKSGAVEEMTKAIRAE